LRIPILESRSATSWFIRIRSKDFHVSRSVDFTGIYEEDGVF